jgi:hypothetical protein
MNDSMIQLAWLRRGEMIREADQVRLAASARRRRPRAARTAQGTGGPLARLTMAAARMRPTLTGR